MSEELCPGLPETITVDGIEIDAETGEVIYIHTPEAFTVKDDDSLNWVMRKILKAEATAESIFRSPEVAEAQAIVDNAKRMLDRARKRVQGLHERFDPEIAEYAKTKLEKGQRTLSTFYGDIAFRKVGSSFAIPDKAAAAEKLASYFPHAVKKELQVSKLTAEDKRMLHAWLTINSNGDQDDEEVVLELKKVIQFVPEHDSVTVRTNLKLKVE